MRRIAQHLRVHWLLTGALLIFGAIAATHAGDGKPTAPAPLFITFESWQSERPMPQYRALWRARVNETAIRQPADAIRLNGPGLEEITVPLMRWSPRAGYIQMYNEDDPERPITIPDPNARPEDFSWHWYGKLGHTVVSLTVERGVLAGRVWHQGRRFGLRPSADGQLLGETNSDYWRTHPDDDEPHPDATAATHETTDASDGEVDRGGGWNYLCDDPLPDMPLVVDVLVLYTEGVLNDAFGDHATVDAIIRQTMNDANDALRNTGITSFVYSLRAVELLPNSQQLDIDPIQDARRWLSGINSVASVPGTPSVCNIAGPGVEPLYDHVLARRNALWADVVALARRDADPIRASCGFSFVQRENRTSQGCPYNPGPEFERFAYMVFDPECGADRLNFAHELGHQLGMEHDRRNSEIVLTTVRKSCPWSNDHRYSAPAPWGFRTLMAYWQPGQTSVTGPACNNDSLCPLIDAYSNPQLEWTGTGGIQPLGTVPGAPPLGNNSPPFRTRANDTLPRLAPVSAAFRPRPDLIFAHGFQ